MDPAELQARFYEGSRRAWRAGLSLHDLEEQWAAVCYFYACYSAARYAFYSDARLDRDSSARDVHAKLSAGSRHVDFHSTHPSRGWGINSVFRALYPDLASKYELMHAKSVEVRYQDGLVDSTLDEVKQLALDVLNGLKEKSLFPGLE